MASSYSNNLRVGLQGAGDNPTTWGTLLNDELFTLLIAAITDLQSISLTAGNVTLTTNNGSADQARAAMLKFTGAPGVARTVTAPAVSKIYILWNDSDGAVTLKTSSGTGVVVAVDEKVIVFCDGTDFYRATLGGQTAETITAAWIFSGAPELRGAAAGNADDFVVMTNNGTNAFKFHKDASDQLLLSRWDGDSWEAVLTINDANGDITLAAGLTISGAATFSDDVEFNTVATFDAEYDNGNSGTSKTIDWNNGQKQKLTLTGNVTLTFTAPPGVGHFQLRLIQDGTGSRTVTWPTIKTPGGAALSVASGASDETIVSVFYNGTSYYVSSISDWV